MRLAYFSPLPPLRTGVAEYSAELLPEIARCCSVDAYVDDYVPTAPEQTSDLRILPYREFESRYEQGDYQNILYHIANNPDHSYIYRQAVRVPGVVLLHDFNLHYLIADTTITCNDWPGYFAELRYGAGEEAMARADQVWRRELDPEYEEYPLNRRILENSRGLIVNNGFLRQLVEQTASHAPVIMLPHGVSPPPSSIPKARASLGLDGATVVGAFGFMKPYKRIYSILRALHAIRELRPEVHLLLAGEEHPHCPLDPLITELDLSKRVHRLGFVSTPDLWGCIEASDICCNLRFPTVGESSGPLMKILALGKPVVVSDIGSYREIPDDCCVKIPAGDTEVEALVRVLTELILCGDGRRRIGEKARTWALAQERSWRSLAEGILAFCEQLPRPGPRITGLIPPKVTVGAPGFSLTAMGGPWSPDSSICWNDSERPTRAASARELQAFIPAEETAAVGVASVSVRDPAGRMQGSQKFPVIHPQARIRTIEPAFAVAGECQLLLKITGGPFVSSGSALWNGRVCPTRWRSVGELEVLVPREELKEARRVFIEVVDPMQQCSGSPYVVRSAGSALPEPVAALELPSGFCIIEVRTAPGTLDGLMALSTVPGPTAQSGALHFGAGIPPAHLPPASCSFSLVEGGRVAVSLHALSDRSGGAFEACVRSGCNKATIQKVASAGSHLEFATELEAGLYVLEVESAGAAGAFLAGSIESGHIASATHLTGWIEETMVGFVAFHSPEPIRADVTTRGRSLGTFGADCLLLEIKDASRKRIWPVGLPA